MTNSDPSPSVDDPAPAAPSADIRTQLIENVSVRLEAYLGGTRMSVGELAALRQGSVVAFDAPLTQAVELRLNGIAIAKGELVSVGEKFAVRLLEICQ